MCLRVWVDTGEFPCVRWKVIKPTDVNKGTLMPDYASMPAVVPAGFANSAQALLDLVERLDGDGLGPLGEVEDFLFTGGQALLRQLFQDHLDAKAARERAAYAAAPGPVRGADGVERGKVETVSTRLRTRFGTVQVRRLSYRAAGVASLRPADAAANLPAASYSHGLQRLLVAFATGLSYDGAIAAVERACGQTIGHRAAIEIIAAAGADIGSFYDRARPAPGTAAGEVVVISADGSGIDMRPEARREGVAPDPGASDPSPAGSLAAKARRGRKRMAEIALVGTITPARRDAAAVMGPDAHPGPRLRDQWLTGSIAEPVSAVIASAFDEASRRDPDRAAQWVALVDGNAHQIDCIETEAAARGARVAIVVDFVHVLQYLWDAAKVFFDHTDQAGDWVRQKATLVLQGRSRAVAAGIRRRATTAGYTGRERANADRAATYLDNHEPYLDYPLALANGWPIATGAIEGAVRHLVKDRFAITGARWGLAGAEAMLTLRATTIAGDADQYWRYHLEQEQHRNHAVRYQQENLELAA